MTDSEWASLSFFRKNEPWGDPSKMDFRFITELERYRKFIGVPVFIHCGTQGSHSEKSFHSKGVAADVSVPNLNLLDAWIDALRFDFTGIGFYPLWTNTLGEPLGGLHLERNPFSIGRRKKLWIGVSFEGGANTKYVAMSEINLMAYYKNWGG